MERKRGKREGRKVEREREGEGGRDGEEEEGEGERRKQRCLNNLFLERYSIVSLPYNYPTPPLALTLSLQNSHYYH